MFNLNQRYTIAQIVELIGTKKQKEQIEIKGKLQTKSKQALLKELETMVKYELIKGRPQYYLITEIYEEQKEKYDGRADSELRMAISELQMLKYLARREDEEHYLAYSYSYLAEYVGLCNEEFRNYYAPVITKKTPINKISDYEMEQQWSKLVKMEQRNKINAALRSLQKKGIIFYSQQVAVSINGVKRNATGIQTQRILDAEKKIMKELQIKNKNELFLKGNGLYRKFYKKVISIVSEYGIEAYYYGVKIISLSKELLNEEINIAENKLKANKKFIEIIEKKCEEKSPFLTEKAKELNVKYLNIVEIV